MRLGSSDEVAEELGVSPSRVEELRKSPDFPDPVGEIALGPIWDLDVLQQWNLSGVRRSVGEKFSSKADKFTFGGRFVREIESIGQGGFADVYRAEDKKTGSTVAIKILRDIEKIEEEAIKRFQRELRIMEELSHPNVVRIIAHGETDEGEIWYTMPLAQGSLQDYISLLKDNPPLIVEAMQQVCSGLDYIHSEGIFHRDLKPANVLRLSGDDGSTDTWAVADFGLAVMAERDTDPLTSTFRQGLGSWVYTAPEQWQNARQANHLSDVYSLGKVLQQLVTGNWPVNAEIPPGVFRPVIEKSISNEPGRRYQSVADFRMALERTLDTERDHQLWETREEQAERLRDRLLGTPSIEELTEVLEWALSLNENEKDDMSALVRVFPWMSATSIKSLWERDSPAFMRVMERFCTHVATESFSFEYCDTLANFLRRVADTTQSAPMLGKIAAALARLGTHHHRWYVRDVLIKLLQKENTPDGAAEIIEALRSIPVDEVRWSITDFTLRTLPRPIRAGLTHLLAQAS